MLNSLIPSALLHFFIFIFLCRRRLTNDADRPFITIIFLYPIFPLSISFPSVLLHILFPLFPLRETEEDMPVFPITFTSIRLL